MNKSESKRTIHNTKVENTKIFSQKPALQNYTRIPMFKNPPKDAFKILDNFDDVLQNIKALSSKHLQSLPYNIQQLSLQLTSERSSRKKTYMNSRVELMTYTRYFMWWNLFRLTNLFSGFPESSFSSLKTNTEPFCLDIGSGPLTLPIALFLARPELREVPLTWYCLDPSQTSLALGEDIFLAIAARLKIRTWKIIKVRGSFGEQIRNPISFITSANMFNELYLEDKRPIEELVKNYAKTLYSYGTEESSILLIEPGIPRTSRFVSLFRDNLIRNKFRIVSPCTHHETCPMPGMRGTKWCHFTMDAENAPKKLQNLSRDASLEKEKVVLSFVFASKAEKDKELNEKNIRITSLPIRLPRQGIGHYACGKKGLLLFIKNKYTIEGSAPLFSGDIIQKTSVAPEQIYKSPKKQNKPKTDVKTGAIIIDS